MQAKSTKPRLLICELASGGEWTRQLALALRTPDLALPTGAELIEDGRLDRLLELVRRLLPNLVFLSFPAGAWAQAIAAVPALHESEASPKIIAITNLESAEKLSELLGLGVADYLLPPFRDADILCRTRRWLGLGPEERAVTSELRQVLGMQGFIGQSSALLAELKKVPRFASTDACVLIHGETGTGKELCARALHHLSRRAAGPFVALNTGAIPTELIENELFGHESGAYTSARSPQRGVIAEAESGTLFLDEIDALPLAAQVKLLRFLQEKEYRPLGARGSISANVRIIAASNLDLAQAVEAGRFRKDLYYRLNVLPLLLPTLSERAEDIPLLAQHFVAKHRTEASRGKLGLAPDALAKLQRYDWPGNVRELENVIERALILSEDWLIHARDIDLPVPESAHERITPPSFRAAKAQLVGRFEREYLEDMLQRHQGNISHAARAAGKNRRAFYALMQKHRITVRVSATPQEHDQGWPPVPKGIAPGP